MSEAHEDAQTTQLMASIRRLQAAYAPGIPHGLVVAEIRKILESDGMKNLLAHAGTGYADDGYFVDVLRRAKACIDETRGDSDRYTELGKLLKSTELGAALMTDDPDEQPERLRGLMLEGPYKSARQP